MLQFDNYVHIVCVHVTHRNVDLCMCSMVCIHLCVCAASGRAGELVAGRGGHVHVAQAGGRREGCR